MRSSGFAELRRRAGPWVLPGILLLAFALRLAGLTSESLWIDEGYSLALAGRSIPEVVRGTAADQHPPLYYLLLHGWLSVGGSVFVLRSLSVVIGTLSVAAGAAAGRDLLGRRAGWAAGLLLACSPMHIWYSQEARMYILLALLTTLSAHLTWRLTGGRGGWVPYGLVTLAALYTHYFSGFVILFENAWALGWGLAQRRRGFLARWAGVQAAVGTAFLPWVPVALYQARFHQMKWLRPPTADTVGNTLALMTLGGGLSVFQSKPLLLAGLGCVALALTWAVWRGRQQEPLLRAYGFLALWLALPFVAVVAVSGRYPLFQAKQFLVLLPPLLVLIAGALAALPRTGRLATAAVLGLFVVSSLGDLYRTEVKHGWREAAAFIEEGYAAGDVLYLNPAAGILTLRGYMRQVPPHAGYPAGYDVVRGGWEGEPVTPATAQKVMGALAAKYRRLWLVEFGPEFWDPEGHLAAWLEGRGRVIADQSYQGVRVRLYELAGGSES